MLLDILGKYLPDIPYINGKELVQHIYTEARLNASDSEKENFYNRYIKTLTLKCEADGTFRIVLRN